ncbi:MAG: DNA polymerase III subunit delta [Flavobacteriaceae bacterium]
MNEAEKIITDIKNRNFKPIYFLMGDEPYYIDKIADYIEKNVLSEDEKGFNQVVLYGRDTTVEEVIANAKRYPMMADYQVVIVKEAQELSRTIDKIESYAENPQPTTILVFCYKYKTLDKRKKATKTLEKNGLVFESKKLYDNQVGSWINQALNSSGYKIEPKANAMLVEFLGTDLSKVNNELEKLKIILPKGTIINAEHIEKNIGISKDYNVFEFRNALGEKNILKANRIANYFSQNPKDNPITLITSQVFAFYVQLLQYHGLSDKNPANVAKTLKVNPYFVKDYETAARNYPMRKVSSIVAALREIDLKSKGVGANALPPGELLKDMLIAVF